MERQYDDEINLVDLWRVIVRRRAIILGLFIASVLLSVVAVSVMPKVYRGEAVLKLAGEGIISLADTKGTGDKKVMSFTSAVTPSEIAEMYGKLEGGNKSKIFSKTQHSIVDAKLTILKGSQDKLKVVIDSKSAEDLPASFLQYMEHLRNSPAIRNHAENLRTLLNKRLEENSKNIESAEQLHSTFRKFLQAGKINVVGFNPLQFEQSISNLRIEKFALENSLKELEKNRGLEILEDFYVFKNPVKPRKALIVAVAGVSGFFVGVFLAFFIEYVRRQSDKKDVQ